MSHERWTPHYRSAQEQAVAQVRKRKTVLIVLFACVVACEADDFSSRGGPRSFEGLCALSMPCLPPGLEHQLTRVDPS